MNLLETVLLLVIGIGLALVLGEMRWFRRPALVTRLRPYGLGTSPSPARSTPDAVLVPLVDQMLDRFSDALGVSDDLETRLARADMAIDRRSFRSKQAVHAVVGLGVGAVAALLVRPGPVVSTLAIAGIPILWVLLDEQGVSSAIARRSHRLQLELPVVAEQLGILVDSGASLPSALSRVSRRGRGAAADDIRRVVLRIRGGTSESDALAEWAERSDVEAVRRLVAVLSLHREAGDLGRLIGLEARAIRAETHRDLIERIERRGQLVWVPVTVATLVPGLLFLAVPFISALSQVTGA